MGIDTDILGDWQASLAALSYQLDLGADEAIGEAPVNRYETVAVVPEAEVAPAASAPLAVPRLPVAASPAPAPTMTGDAVNEARRMAAGARSLAQLREAMAAYEHCELKRGAKSLVFADGNPDARVLVLGEAPGREEDQQGLPFVGRAGQLLDRMFGAIGLARDAPEAERAIYITNVLPWRPPQNRDPSPAEIAMLLPFVERHIALVDPEVIVVMGNTPLAAMLGVRGITRLRGQWAEALGRPVLPMFHPAYLLRTPSAKREAWADLLSLQSRLRAGS